MMENIDQNPYWLVNFEEVTLEEEEHRSFAENNESIQGCLYYPGVGRPIPYGVALDWDSGEEITEYKDSLPDSAYLVMRIHKTHCPREEDAQEYANIAWDKSSLSD
jgi:hypothetical protein